MTSISDQAQFDGFTLGEVPLLPERPHILVFSGWQTINIGDIGHTPGCLRWLEEFYPEAQATLWLANGNEAILTMLQARFSKLEIVHGHMSASGQADNPVLQDAFDQADLVIYNSGMIFNGFWPSPTWFLSACETKSKPFGLFGQSFDGFSPDEESLIAQRLSRAEFIFCRDEPSLRYLESIGVKSSVLAFGPDACFGIDVVDEATAALYLQQNGLEPGQFITITIRTHTPKLSGASDALNPSAPTKNQIEEDEGRAAWLRSLITGWVQTTGQKVLLAPEIDKEIEPARRYLLDPLPPEIRQCVVHRDRFWTVEEAAAIYARASTVVSMEPHSCIIALANGTPVLHAFTPNHGRKGWMFRDLGLDKSWLLIDEEPVTAALEILIFNRRHPQTARREVHHAMLRVREHAKHMVEAVRSVAGHTGARQALPPAHNS